MSYILFHLYQDISKENQVNQLFIWYVLCSLLVAIHKITHIVRRQWSKCHQKTLGIVSKVIHAKFLVLCLPPSPLKQAQGPHKYVVQVLLY